MSLHLIYGSARSEKTEYLYDLALKRAEEEPDLKVILLVPEQASLSVQKEMIRRSPYHALFNTDVLTFNRLAFRVFEEVNEKELTVLDDAEKGMLLRLIMKRRTKDDSLLRRNLNKKGFVEEIKSLISEMVQYNVTPEKLKDSLNRLEDYPYLRDKLSQVTSVYEEFMALLQDRYQMREERMTLLARKVREWPLLKDSIFLLDGFTGFTPPQIEVLTRLMSGSRDVYVSLVLGSGSVLEDNRNEEDLFHMTYQCAASLKERAITRGVSYDETHVLKKVPGPEDLKDLEERLYRYPEKIREKEPEAISLYRMSSRTEEAQWLLSDILKQIREGKEYRDLAVIASDMGAYREELEVLFDEAGIPCFFDENRDLARDPLIMLLEALKDLVNEGFSFESVIHLMKNPLMIAELENRLTSEDRFTVYERVSEFENFLLATGIRGRKAYEREWTAPKRFADIRMQQILELKEAFTGVLFPLEEKLSKEGPLNEKIRAVREFLQTIQAEESLSSMAEDAGKHNDPILEREYTEVYEKMEELFQKMELILGDETLSREECFDVLSTGLSELRLSLLPPTLDRLVIGDLKRTRLSGIKRLYIIGANEGMFPPGTADTGFLSDIDRRILKEKDIPLSPGAREESFNLQLYVYLALTNPEESLVLSYAQADPDGKILQESPVLTHLKTIFPALKTGEVKDTVLTLPSKGLLSVSRAIRKNREERERGIREEGFSASVRGLYSWIRSEKRFDRELALMEEGLFYRYKPESLSDQMTGKLYRESLTGSVSFFEQYAGCAYRHFLSYGLKLSERQEYGLNAADFGTLFHDSIDVFFRKLKEEGLNWNELLKEDRIRLSAESVSEVTKSYTSAAYTENARNEYIMKRVLRLTDRTLWALKDQWDKGGFTKTETEVTFRGGKNLPGMILDLSGGLSLSLQGRIDRIDVSEEDDRIYVRVIDYKSGSTDLNYTRIFYGLQLQLLLYMQAAGELVRHKNPGKEIVPAGFYYYHIQDPVVEPKEGKTTEDLILNELRLSGVTNSDEKSLNITDRGLEDASGVVRGLKRTKSGFDMRSKVAGTEDVLKLQDFAREKMKELTGRLLNGDITVDPYLYGQEDGCTYCAYKGICGFDDKISGFRKRRLKKKELSDLLGEDEDA